MGKQVQLIASPLSSGLHPELPAAKRGVEWGRFTLRHPDAWWMSAAGG